MKSNYLSLFIFIFLLDGCNNIQEPINDKALPKNNISKPYKIRGDGKSDLLGFAFDATGVFLDPDKQSYAVLDIVKLTNNSLVFHDDPMNSELDITTGSDAKTLLKKYQNKFTADGGFNIGTDAIPFIASLSAEFIGSNTTTSKTTYANADINVKVSHWAIKPYTSIEALQNCLSDEFIGDVQNFTPDQIISKYGTHVYTDIFTGGRLHFTYKCYTYSSNKEEAANYYAKVGVGRATESNLTLSATTSNITSTTATVQQEIFDYHSYGGSGASIVGSWTPGLPPVINFNNWSSTVKLSDPASLQTIKVADNSLMPIYNFVSDPTKKAALKTAIDNYINSKSQLTVISVKPIYRYYGTYNHLLTKNLDELGAGVVDHTKGWVYEGIAAFMCEQQVPGTVPVYRFYKTIKKNVGLFSTNTYFDHYYTTNYSSGISNGYADEGIIGYIFTSQQNNTKPFWQYYNSTLYDHMYTTSNELYGTLGGNGYQYNNPIGYVIEGTRNN